MKPVHNSDEPGGEQLKFTLLLLTAYSAAMGLLEAAVVVYMRQLYYPENPLKLFPLQFLDHFDPAVELSREVATIMMILTVALMAERRSFTRRFAAFVFVFGAWDLTYYGGLKLLMDWPQSWLEWDVLFLIPCVWLGPWICPAIIATLFVVWGFWGIATTKQVRFTPLSLGLFVLGAGLGLVTFMQPAISHGAETLNRYEPGAFWWWLFIPGCILMGMGLCLTGPDRSTNPAHRLAH